MTWNNPPAAPGADQPRGVVITDDNRDAAMLEVMERGDTVARAMARACASDWPTACHQWLLAEVARDTADALQALIQMQMSIFASFVGQAVPPALHDELCEYYARKVGQQLRHRVREVEAEVARAKR